MIVQADIIGEICSDC